MNCPNCQNNLPDGALFCNICGEMAAATTPTQPASQPGTVCPHCRISLPPGIQICFRCGKTIHAPSEPIGAPVPIRPGTVPPISQPSAKRKSATAIAAMLALFLLLGAAAGGHFLGFYTLPLLPEPGETRADTQPQSHGANSGTETPEPGQAQTQEQSPDINSGTDQIIGTKPKDWEGVRLEPLYILPHAEIHIDSENPMRGTVKLKGFDIPDTLTLGLPGYEDWQTYAHIGVAFTCNDEVVYEVAVSEFAKPYDDERREVALSERQAQLWVHDPHAGHGTGYDKGRAWVDVVSADSITMGFAFDPDAYVDMSKIKYIGYEYRLYDDIREESIYDRSIESTGEWVLIENVNLSSYAGPNREFYREQQRRKE